LVREVEDFLQGAVFLAEAGGAFFRLRGEEGFRDGSLPGAADGGEPFPSGVPGEKADGGDG